MENKLTFARKEIETTKTIFNHAIKVPDIAIIKINVKDNFNLLPS